MQGNRGEIRQRTPVWTCTQISRTQGYGINKCKPTEPSLTKTDIIIYDKEEEGTSTLIDVAISRDENVIKEGAERIS